MKKKDWIKLIILVLILFAFDMLTKYFFYNLEKLDSLQIIKPIINTWVSFGFQIPLTLVIIISILALMLFWWLFYKKNISRIVAGLLIAWTFGNLIDRFIFGGVRDFVSIWRFPIFNIADVLLNIWIFIFFIKEFFNWKENSDKHKKINLIS